MSKLICPFCQHELLLSSFRDGDKDNEIWNCLHCQIGGQRKLWQELIRTRKALDIAVKRLGYIKNNYKSWTPDRDAQMIAQAANGLDEIKTALEQKD